MHRTIYPNTHKPCIQTRWLSFKKTPKIVENRTINIPHHQKGHKTYHPRHQLEITHNHHQPTKSPTIITNLQNHPHTIIPNPQNDPTLVNEWIKTLGSIGKTAKKNARDIITKQTSINCKKTISKYRNTLNLQPKRIHKVIFKNTENTTLDSIKDRQGNILTNPEDIAEEFTSNNLY
jgi:hypothetical protein